MGSDGEKSEEVRRGVDDKNADVGEVAKGDDSHEQKDAQGKGSGNIRGVSGTGTSNVGVNDMEGVSGSRIGGPVNPIAQVPNGGIIIDLTDDSDDDYLVTGYRHTT